jgi:hypothetical protein
MQKRKQKIVKESRITVNLTLLISNWKYLLSYIASVEAGQNIKITPSRAINAMLSQMQYGFAVPNEEQFRSRRRPLSTFLDRKSTKQYRADLLTIMKEKAAEGGFYKEALQSLTPRPVSSKLSNMTEAEMLAVEDENGKN